MTEVATEAIELTIDGRRVTARRGETVLQAARRSGTYIPTLCFHPDLDAYGGCRLCIVEIAGQRGYPTACTTQVAPGMDVKTATPDLENVRGMTVELLLADHSSDCITCAADRSCELQKVAAHLGLRDVRFRKTQRNLPLDTSNPFFVRDPNRCILCGICTRTCADIQGLGAIELVGRGYRTSVGTFREEPLRQSLCASCGECVARCPTGALSNRERAKATKWDTSTCTFCGTGCGLKLGSRGGRIVAVEGDAANPVNDGVLCVKGRYGFEFVNSPQRLRTPLVRRDGKFVETTWDEALDLVARRFAEYRGAAFAAVGSSRGTNEENYVVQKFTRAVMRTNNVDNCARLCHAPTVAGLAKAFGTGGGTNPLADIDGASCLFVIGSNTSEAHPAAGARIRRAIPRATLIVADPRRIDLAGNANVWLQQRPGTDVPLLMGMAKVILDEGLHDPEFVRDRCEQFDEFAASLGAFDLKTVEAITGVPGERIATAARLYATRKPSFIIYSLGITEHSHGVDNVLAVANLAMLTGNLGKPSAGVMPMRGQNNVQGACDMGCIPYAYQGYQAVADPATRKKHEDAWGCGLPDAPGLTLVEQFQQVLAGTIKCLYVVGMDVAYSIADTTKVHEALRKAEFVVFQDIFLTGSAEFAHVVLPAACFAEKDGTFTNLERRVQLIRPAVDPPGVAKPDWWITAEIARRMGARGFDYTSAAEIMHEIASLTPSFAGISLERLATGGIQWPCPSADHPGTGRLHVERFNTPSGKGRLAPLTYRPSAEAPDAEYPFLLSTGRGINHFHLAMTRHVPGLLELHPEELISLHPADARRLRIKDGEPVQVTSRRGTLRVKAKLTDMVARGMAWMTFHFYETPTNVLTQQALDPVSKTPEFKVTAVRIEKVAARKARPAAAVGSGTSRRAPRGESA
jgi:formate dehydrogenase alpha subunit